MKSRNKRDPAANARINEIPPCPTTPSLSQSSGFTFGLEQAENIVFADYIKVHQLVSLQVSHSLAGAKPKELFACDGAIVPGPLTLRIMLRVVSSMNSTLTWVTPPREPIPFISAVLRSHLFLSQKHTGTAQDTGDLHKLDGNL